MVASMEKMSLNRAGDSLQPSHPLPEGLPRSGVRPAVKKPRGKLGFATVSTPFVLRTNKLRAGVFTSVSMPPLKVFSQRNRKVNHIFKLVLIVTGRLSEQFQDHLFPLSLYYKIFLEVDRARKIITFFFFFVFHNLYFMPRRLWNKPDPVLCVELSFLLCGLWHAQALGSKSGLADLRLACWCL